MLNISTVLLDDFLPNILVVLLDEELLQNSFVVLNLFLIRLQFIRFLALRFGGHNEGPLLLQQL